MAHVRFEVHQQFESSSRDVWDELVDWKGHEAWIPVTTVDVGPGDPTDIGATFTATTGFRPLALEDRMRVTRCEWNDDTDSGECEVEKLGPILTGSASFTVAPDGAGSVVNWYEDVTVPYAPQFVAPVLGWLGAMGFRTGMRKLAKLLVRSRSGNG
jgi:hypothetical protein